MLGPQADIVLAYQRHKRKSTCQINLRREKGHKEKGKKYEDISKAAQLNVDLDLLAEKTRLYHPIVPLIPYPGSGAILTINGKQVTTNYKSCIKNAVMEPINKEYFLEKYKKHNSTEYV